MPEVRTKHNILIVHNRYLLPGGEDTVVENEKRLLEENGHKVFTYIRSNKLPWFRKALLPLTMFFDPFTFFAVRKIIRQKGIDIVHVHNTAHVIFPSVYYAARSRRVPVVQTIHNYRLSCPAGSFYRNGKICDVCTDNKLTRAIRHGCYRGSKLQTLAVVLNMKLHRAAGIYRDLNYITLSQFGKGILLRSAQVLPDHVFIKPNFTYASGDHPTVRDKQEPYYLFSGRLEEIKGVRLVAEAFRQMPGKRLKIAGDGPLMDEIRSMIRDNTVNNIELLGWVPHDEFRRLLRDSLALIICPQCQEPFSMLTIEAFAEHTPVIGGNIGNIPNLVKDKTNGILFQYDSAAGLMEAIGKFEACDRKELAENAFKNWEERYSPEENYRELARIYNDVQQSGTGHRN